MCLPSGLKFSRWGKASLSLCASSFGHSSHGTHFVPHVWQLIRKKQSISWWSTTTILIILYMHSSEHHNPPNTELFLSLKFHLNKLPCDMRVKYSMLTVLRKREDHRLRVRQVFTVRHLTASIFSFGEMDLQLVHQSLGLHSGQVGD